MTYNSDTQTQPSTLCNTDIPRESLRLIEVGVVHCTQILRELLRNIQHNHISVNYSVIQSPSFLFQRIR